MLHHSNTKYLKIARDYDENSFEETLNSPRGVEIYWSLKQYPSITQYIILDDIDDMLYCQRNNFIQTANLSCNDAINGYGLTNKCTQLAIDVLLREVKDI